MTDITELAQSLKNAASKALIEEGLTWFSEEQLSYEDGIALHKADAEFIALANPANVLTLVEALEKAQQLATQQGNIACALFDEVTAHRQRIAELEEIHAQVIQSRDHYKHMSEEGLKKLAESRTVTVKLPEVRITVAESRRRNMTWRELGAYNEGADVAAERIGKVLTAQGIKWEAE
ncbi:MAG: ead/Ea22-like family protein [Klebsiella aerogenes]|nr:ead/Ea22-like family protein [Klebsiella aerogenes]